MRDDQAPGRPLEAPSDFAPPRVRLTRLSETAARAAQYVEDLEATTRDLSFEASQLKAHISVLERTNEILQTELTALRGENERLLRENVTVAAKISAAATLLLDLRTTTNTQKDPANATSQTAELLEDSRGTSIPAGSPNGRPLGGTPLSEDPLCLDRG